MGDLENNVENQQYVVEIKSLKRYFSCKDNVAENISFLPSKDAHEKKKKEVRMKDTGEKRIFSDINHSLLSVLGP